MAYIEDMEYKESLNRDGSYYSRSFGLKIKLMENELPFPDEKITELAQKLISATHDQIKIEVEQVVLAKPAQSQVQPSTANRPPSNPSDKISEPQKQLIHRMAGKHSSIIYKFLDKNGKATSSDLTKSEASELISIIKSLG